MNISLTPQLAQFIKGKVESGMYHSASEVIRDALRLLQERERLQEVRLESLRKEIQIGVDQLERGEYTEYDEHALDRFFAGIRNEGRSRLEAKGEIGG
jgi:antitoxin ParD1/3/4